MALDPNAKSDMMALIEAMGNAGMDSAAETQNAATESSRGGTERAEVFDMKNFLSIVTEEDAPSQISPAIRNPIREPRRDNILAEAMVTSKTPHGARVGDWEIRVKEIGKTKRYDVIHSDTETVIADNLYLSEAASSLVSALNSGKGINHPSIRPILEAEDEYARCVVDAAHHTRMLREAEQNGDETRSSIFEARLSESRGRAKSARERVRNNLK